MLRETEGRRRRKKFVTTEDEHYTGLIRRAFNVHFGGLRVFKGCAREAIVLDDSRSNGGKNSIVSLGKWQLFFIVRYGNFHLSQL